MESIITVAAGLALTSLATVTTPAVAGTGLVEIRVNDGYYPTPVYVAPPVIYESPAPAFRYRNDRRWREHVWRERQRREYWRERNEWLAQQWREHRERSRWESRRDFMMTVDKAYRLATLPKRHH
jgi:hypothetical protein